MNSLSAWLQHLEQAHAGQPIQLGLERVQRVLARMSLPKFCPIITVGGTNGKGSTCAMLEAVLRHAGYRVGVYSSPHILQYNERVRVAGQLATDAQLVAGFNAVEAARVQGDEVPLTYFEMGTLCAWYVFAHANLDALILEVGLGGRLDAVNVFEPDCAVVTGVALDHQAFLGDTREQIGFEKAGIFRAGKPAVVGDPMPPQSLLDYAAQIGAQLWVSGRDFGFGGQYDNNLQQWHYWRRTAPATENLLRHGGLAYPALRGTNQLLNASSVISALEVLKAVLPVSMGDVRAGMMSVSLPARYQVLPGKPAIVLDVAHNPQATAVLDQNLSSGGFFPETHAVVGMLKDKDIQASLAPLTKRVDHWYLASLQGPRAASAHDLNAALQAVGARGQVRQYENVAQALAAAQASATEADRIAVFGSFLTVADAMAALQLTIQ